MTDFDPYEQIANQKAVARAQRRKNGADTRLDEAEVRYDAIVDMLWEFRFWGPFGPVFAFGWMGREPAVTWALACGWILVVYFVAGLIGLMVDGVFKAFFPRLGTGVETAIIALGGAPLALVGLIAAPAVVAGGVLMMTRWWWWPLCWRHILSGTDYMRMRRAFANPPPPRIME